MQHLWSSTSAFDASAAGAAANLEIFLTLLGALFLGLIVGYERTYHGRAVGMRTYGLVCMSSAALTTFVGYPALWYGGHANIVAMPDPTRVVQGIVTGIGFLGAGVIMKDGLNIRGLTTAASVWSVGVIGVLMGVGFHGAAIVLAAMSTLCMLYVHQLENWLPSHAGIAVVVQFKKGAMPSEHAMQDAVQQRGYKMVEGSLSINVHDGLAEWHFIATTMGRKGKTSMAELARIMSENERVAGFQLAHARN